MIILKKNVRRFFQWDLYWVNSFFGYFVRALGVLFILLFCFMAVLIFIKSWPAFYRFGLSFFINPTWNSWKQEFGALSLIYGTLVSSILALCLAIPVSLGLALFLNEIAPKWLSRILSFVVEMLAAIPSIVYGLWGVFILAPFLRDPVQTFLSKHLGHWTIFSGSFYGIGMMCAAIILAIMITPTITSICKEVFRSIPRAHKESVLSLGSTRWEMFKIAILRGGFSGIVAAVILGFGRAFGETMAVTMVIGNKPVIDFSVFAPSQTMASILATQYAEADTNLHLASLTAIACTLFVVSLLFNSLSTLLILKLRNSKDQKVY